MRKQIPAKTKKALQQEINSQCPFCGSKEIEYFEFHHIDSNSENSVFENLIMVCPTCHAKITQGDIKAQDVKDKKKSIVEKTAFLEDKKAKRAFPQGLW